MTTAPSPGDIARDLETRHPHWAVLWRHWARRYWAFPLWITTDPEPIEANQIQELLSLMKEVELQHRPPGAYPYPPIRRGDRPPAT
ncbi:hypothetical protein [Streptosporangium sp. NPDC000396]|uniref:hypothetical protein n=1 Tax=Streptosporangium sp. NPDC000396 TaxID=3366185 RepID=UPI003699159C